MLDMSHASQHLVGLDALLGVDTFENWLRQLPSGDSDMPPLEIAPSAPPPPATKPPLARRHKAAFVAKTEKRDGCARDAVDGSVI
jgi:hypothetical protein